MPVTITPQHSGMKADESCEWTVEKKTREGGEKERKKEGVPWLGQEFRAGVCHLLSLACNPAQEKLYRPLQTPKSVSNYPPLIGFNERFNSAALPNQIKLLLSTVLNPGSLLCQACFQDPPFCCLLPHTFSLSLPVLSLSLNTHPV